MLFDTIYLVARLLVGGAFLYSWVQHFFQLTPISLFMHSRGVPYPRQTLIVGSAFQAVCGLLVIVDLWLPWASIGLIGFTIAASIMFHNFWDKKGAERQSQLNAILKNVAAIGGMMMLAIS